MKQLTHLRSIKIALLIVIIAVAIPAFKISFRSNNAGTSSDAGIGKQNSGCAAKQLMQPLQLFIK